MPVGGVDGEAVCVLGPSGDGSLLESCDLVARELRDRALKFAHVRILVGVLTGDDIGIPRKVHVPRLPVIRGARTKEADLLQVPSIIGVLHGIGSVVRRTVERLVEVADEVDDKAQSFRAPVCARIGQHLL